MFSLLGPLSSASPKGQGPFFSWLFILVGTWGVVSTIVDYRRRRQANARAAALWVIALCLGFAIVGICGLVRG